MTLVHLVTGLLFCLAISTIHALSQDRGRGEKGAASSTSDQIEVKTDRFSNVTTVTLKPMLILDKPDHIITMEIEAKLGEEKDTESEKENIYAYIKFESQTTAPVDFGDEELHFIVNGELLNVGELNFKVTPYASRYGKLKPGFKISESGGTILDREDLERFIKANRIEMRIGSIEPQLSKALVATLREYAIQTLAQYKIAREKQK
jgi:hypothetical protein